MLIIIYIRTYFAIDTFIKIIFDPWHKWKDKSYQEVPGVWPNTALRETARCTSRLQVAVRRCKCFMLTLILEKKETKKRSTVNMAFSFGAATSNAPASKANLIYFNKYEKCHLYIDKIIISVCECPRKHNWCTVSRYRGVHLAIIMVGPTCRRN